MEPLRILLAIVAILTGSVAAQAASNEAIKRNNFGGELVKQGRLAEAVTEFQSAIQADPRYGAAHLNLAFTMDRLGRTEEAISAYKQAIALDPTNATALNNLGVLYSRKGADAEAMDAFENALKLDPTNATLQKNLESAKASRKIRDEREARIAEAVKQAETLPRDPRAAYQVARVYASFDMRDEAFVWLGKALNLGFDDIRFVREEDPVIGGLRKDPRFSRLLEGR